MRWIGSTASRPAARTLQLLVVLGSLVAPAALLAQPGLGVVSGAVRDSLGSGIAGAQVTLGDSLAHAVSDGRGRFRLAGIRPGRYTLRARRLGFEQGRIGIRVAPDSTALVSISLNAVARTLAAVVVRQQREVYDARLAGFYERREKDAGAFIGRDRIELAHSSSFTALLQAVVPGVRVSSRGGIARAVRLRGARCAPIVFLDGFPAGAGEFDVEMLDLDGVEAIEVYSSMATVPPAFMAARMLDRCGVIAVWTRPARARAARWPAAPAAPVGEMEALIAEQLVFTAETVDEGAQLDSGTFRPIYPDSLWRAGIGGETMLEFAVDTSGVPEPGTLRLLPGSDLRFEPAVRAAIADAQFTPARRNGRTVRQLVALPVRFVPSAAGPPPPETPPP